jgi:hypothetical protein
MARVPCAEAGTAKPFDWENDLRGAPNRLVSEDAVFGAFKFWALLFFNRITYQIGE